MRRKINTSGDLVIQARWPGKLFLVTMAPYDYMTSPFKMSLSKQRSMAKFLLFTYTILEQPMVL